MALENNIIGMVHGLLFSGPGNTTSVMRGEGTKDYVLKTMQWLLDEPGFESIEITRIKSSSVRKEVKSLLQKGLKDKQIKEVVYSAQPIQLINEDKICVPSDICSLDERERNKAVDRLKDCVDEALSYGFITKFAFYSGKDPVFMNGDEGANSEAVRSQALSQLRRSVHELCAYIKDKSGKQQMVPLLEVFDFRKNPDGTKFFKEALIGPIDRTEHFLESVRNLYGHPELGVMLDISHMVISGEGPDTMKNLAPYIRHVHLANVILNRNTANAEKRYGDVHPGFGVPDSEVDEEVLSGYLRALVEIDYQDTISFELNPIDSEIPEQIAQNALSFANKCQHRIDVNYALIHNFVYQNRKFFSEDLWEQIGQLRVEKPQLIEQRMKKRKMRKSITNKDGKLVILAADHPARMVTNVPGDPTRMADRYDYLGRCARVLMASSVDGLMATADVIEDLVLIDHLYQEKTKKSFMDEKLLVACMNRSGLAGATHEMMDKVTAYRDVKKIKALNLDGAKMLLRFAIPDSHDRYVIQTMEECSRYIEACNEIGVPMFLEPLPVEKVDGKYKLIMTADALTRVIGIATGLSSSTSNLWLKVPYVDDYYRVAQAFSGPILMLGGESTGNPVGVLEHFVRGMGEGANVRGAMVGRNVLYPGQDDPAAVAEAVCDVCRKGSSALEAVKTLNRVRGHQMDMLPRE